MDAWGTIRVAFNPEAGRELLRKSMVSIQGILPFCHSPGEIWSRYAWGRVKHGPQSTFRLMEIVDFVHLSMPCPWEGTEEY